MNRKLSSLLFVFAITALPLGCLGTSELSHVGTTAGDGSFQTSSGYTTKHRYQLKEDYDLTPITKTKAEWKAQLTADQYFVTRRAGTEYAFDNEYWDNDREGIYQCVCCELPLYTSETKYKSGTGWPSFWAPVDDEHVSLKQDRGLFLQTRTEVLCARCDAHLGHVFDDGPAPTGMRYCMNSAALKFEEATEE